MAGQGRDTASLTTVVVCGCLIAMLTFGARSAFGLYLEPISASRGWGREVFSVAIGLQNILWGIGGPIAGALAYRYGTRAVLIGGTFAYALGLATVPLSTTPWMLNLTLGGLVGLGGAGAGFGLVMAAVGQMVPAERRSWAMGIIVAASSLGQFLLSFINQGLITAFGWATALVVAGVMLLAVIPLSLPYRPLPAQPGVVAQSVGEALREAAGNRSYVLLTVGFFVCGYHLAFIQTHLPAYIADAGVAPWVGAAAIAVVGLANIVGSYAAGVLGGRHSKKNLLCLIYLARAVVIGVYVLVPPSGPTTLVFAGALGLLWLSTVPLTSGLIAVMFGPRHMATLFGIVFLSHQLGALAGVWLGGRWYDVAGNYDLVWWTMVGMGVLAAIVHWPIVEQPVARLQRARAPA
jgi:MFS family permease